MNDPMDGPLELDFRWSNGEKRGLVSGKEAGNRAYGHFKALALQFTTVELLIAKSVKADFVSGSFYQ